jgi:DNA-binding transcriptional MerR regulator
MTPSELLRRQEQVEDAYKRGDIREIGFFKRMSALGFPTQTIRDALEGLNRGDACRCRMCGLDVVEPCGRNCPHD